MVRPIGFWSGADSAPGVQSGAKFRLGSGSDVAHEGCYSVVKLFTHECKDTLYCKAVNISTETNLHCTVHYWRILCEKALKFSLYICMYKVEFISRDT